MPAQRWLISLASLVVACGDPQAPSGGDGTGSSGSADSADTTADSLSSVDETGPVVDGDGSSTGTTTPPPGDSSDETTGEPLLGPPYPIFLAHGFFGFENLADLRFVPYWHGVPEYLESLGHTVCVGEVDPFNDSTDRGEQLAEQIIECADQTGHAKVNVIGHSQGGLDSRVAAHLATERIASVTTFATPHYGTPIADIALGLTDNDGAAALIDWLVQTLGTPIWDEVGNETSLAEALYQMSTPGIAEFNETYPDVPDLPYISVTGRTGLHSGGEDCEPTGSPVPFVTDYAGTLDTTDSFLLIPEAILSDGIFTQTPNDGLVRAVDSRWGEFLGCVPADHLDEVGQLLGDSPGLGNDWDHLSFYGDLVALLRDRGL